MSTLYFCSGSAEEVAVVQLFPTAIIGSFGDGALGEFVAECHVLVGVKQHFHGKSFPPLRPAPGSAPENLQGNRIKNCEIQSYTP